MIGTVFALYTVEMHIVLLYMALSLCARYTFTFCEQCVKLIQMGDYNVLSVVAQL